MDKPPLWDHDIDCEGLLCPLPVLRAAKALRAMAPGTVLRIRATDGMAAIDLPHFCAEAGHAFLSAAQKDGIGHYLIRRGPIRENPDAPETAAKDGNHS